MPKRKRTRGKRRGGRMGRKRARRARPVYRKALRSRFSRPTTTRQRGVGVAYPERYRCKLVYEQLTAVTSTGGATIGQTFRLNQCYDPDYTGGGSQPYFYDQLAAAYTTMHVFGSSIRVTANAPEGTGLSTHNDVTVIPSKDSTTFTGTAPDVVREQPYATTRSFMGSTTIKKYMGALKLFGYPPSRIKYDTQAEYSTTSGTMALPTYWHIVVNSSDYNTTHTNVMIRVRLVYYCEFTGRIRVGGS